MAFPTGVKAYWKLEDANDALGVYNLTNSNVTFSTGKINNGAVFNGTNANLVKSSGFSLLNSAFSINFWIKPQTIGGIGYGMLMVAGNGTDTLRIFLGDNGDLEIDQYPDEIGNTRAYGLVTMDTWQMLTFVWDGSTTSIYKNGSYVTSSSAAYDFTTLTSLYIGSGTASSEWAKGMMDEIGIWQKELSSDEVSALYNSGNGASDYLTLAGVSYWKLDESSGDASDSMGSNTGTNTDVTYSTGKINNGGVFDGSTSVLNIADDVSLQPTYFTISAWIKTASYADGPTIFQSFSNNTNQAGIRLVLPSATGGICRLKIGKNTGAVLGTDFYDLDGTTVVSDDVWHHCVGIYDGSYMRLYIDGSLDAEYAWTDNPAYAATNYISIGAGYNDGTLIQRVTGTVDEVGIWNRALTAGEVLALYNANDGQQHPFELAVGVSDKIATTSDDCFDDATNIDLDGASELIMGQHPSLSFEYTGGFRFKNLNIPQGATIVEAKITMVNQGNSNGTPSFLIKGEDADDSTTFSTHADFVGRSRTTASVAWTPGAQTTGTILTTVDIKDVVQEIVDRAGWSSGNDMGFFIENNGTNSWILVYDYTGGASYAAQIQIAYSIGTAYELLCAVTAYTLTGINTIFNKAISIILTAGSFTLTGIDILINRGKGMVCSVANFILTGLNINIRGAGSWKWRNGTKNTIDAGDITNETKTVVSATNETKNNSTWVNDSK